MTEIDLYIAGVCTGNPGAGGWGAILRMGTHEKPLSGAEAGTTLNRMELTAAIRALRALIEPCEVTLHAGSPFLGDGLVRWTAGWTRKGWESVSLRPVRNADLWHALIGLAEPHDIRCTVGADNGHGERAHALAQEALRVFEARDPG